MRAFPIIPTAYMIIICFVLIFISLKGNHKKTHILLIILMFILNQRYMIPTENAKALANNIDVLFVIDNTISMNAEDYNGKEKRLSGVKKDCDKITKELNGARFAIITFNNKSKVLTPFTNDAYMTSESIEITEPIAELYARGSSLNTPLEDIEHILNNSYTKDPSRIRVLFFISDGEITDDSTLKSYSSIRKYVQEGAVLGYGTSKGGIMHYKETYSYQNNEPEKVVLDKTAYPYKNAISKIDEKNLKQIANDAGIDYIHMDQPSKIDPKLKKIKSLMKQEMTSIAKTGYEDIYYFFAIPILIIIVIDLKRTRNECV